MEGISDGMAVDHCYYCALLFPELDACPQCGNRFRYQPARMQNAATVESEIASAITVYLNAPSTTTATELLKLWHEVGEQADSLLAREHISIAQLQVHFDAPSGHRSDASEQ
jgi:hypothetical protein